MSSKELLGKGQELGRMQQCIKAKPKTTMASGQPSYHHPGSPLHNSATSSQFSTQARFHIKVVWSFKMWTIIRQTFSKFSKASKLKLHKAWLPHLCSKSLFSIIGSTNNHDFSPSRQTCASDWRMKLAHCQGNKEEQ